MLNLTADMEVIDGINQITKITIAIPDGRQFDRDDVTICCDEHSVTVMLNATGELLYSSGAAE